MLSVLFIVQLRNYTTQNCIPVRAGKHVCLSHWCIPKCLGRHKAHSRCSINRK